MRPPFQLIKKYSTHLTAGEILEWVQEKLNRKQFDSIWKFKRYEGSITGQSFTFHEKSFGQGQVGPKISGIVMSAPTTTVTLKISPPYLRMIFLLFISAIFIGAAILTNEMKVNGVMKVPHVSERIFFGLLGGGLPLLLCYLDYARSPERAEAWLQDELKLKELEAFIPEKKTI